MFDTDSATCLLPQPGDAGAEASNRPRVRRIRPRLPLPPLASDGPTGPTHHPPRSEGKLRVLAARAARRLPLFHPLDAPGGD